MLETHIKSLNSLKTYATIMRRCGNVERIKERPKYGHDVEMMMMYIYLNDLMSKMRFIGHESRSYD